MKWRGELPDNGELAISATSPGIDGDVPPFGVQFKAAVRYPKNGVIDS